MKSKTFLFSLVTLFISLNALSQKDAIEFGLKAGLNYSNLIIDSNFPMKTNPKVGFHLGGYFSFGLTENLRLKPELLFSTQNTEIEYSEDINFGDPYDPDFGVKHTADLKQNLLLLPIMLDYYFNNSFDLEFGPQLGYVVTQKWSYNFDWETTEPRYDKFEVALTVGAGFNFAENYRMGLCYNYGITKRDEARSSVFQLGLAYKL